MIGVDEVVRKLAAGFSYDPDVGFLDLEASIHQVPVLFRKTTGLVIRRGQGGVRYDIPLAKLAWYLGRGEFPKSRVLFRDRNPRNLVASNLYTADTSVLISLTKADLEARFKYDPITGEFTRASDGRPAGWLACIGENKRLVITIYSRVWQVSHLVFLLQTGELPKKGLWVDHKDGNPLNNSWDNLRIVTPGQNVVNARESVLRAGRKYLRGVRRPTWAKPGCYYASAMLGGKTYQRGPFPTQEAAHEAYKKLHAELHGTFSVYASRPETSPEA